MHLIIIIIIIITCLKSNKNVKCGLMFPNLVKFGLRIIKYKGREQRRKESGKREGKDKKKVGEKEKIYRKGRKVGGDRRQLFVLVSGNNLPWVNEIRYLGIFIVSHASFRCSTDHAKRSFYRAANAIFAKVGGFASKEVILELIL